MIRLLPLAGLVLLAVSATAQESPVVNPLGDLPALLARGEVVPDTTEPWRYFPLGVGDAWEYYHYQTGQRRRVEVIGEETHNGIGYVTWRSRDFHADGSSAGTWGPWPVRYDTAKATVRIYVPSTGYEWEWFPWALCRLDAGFGDEIPCFDREVPFEVSGTYDGALVFGGAYPGEGTDTLRTAVKRYYSFSPGHTIDVRHAAGIGYVFEENELGAEGIYYARVGGVEYGEPRLAVSAEGGPGAAGTALAVEAWPNPFRDRLTVALTLSGGGPAVLQVVDMLGREVARRDLGALAAGAHTLPLDLGPLPAGAYVVRLRTEGSVAASRLLARVP
jgi:hypothetical protein